MGTNIRAQTLPHKLRGQVTHRGSAEEVKLHGFKLTHGLQVGLLSVWRAAASHRLRYLMWETQFGKGREAERERRGEHTNASPLGLHKIHLDFSESRFLSSVATVRWICNVQYNGYFSLKKMSILLAKQSPRTSKMATRNTSSSDALLDGSPAHLACDRSRAAARGL